MAKPLTQTPPLTARDVAERFGVTVSTVAKWARAGKLASTFRLDGVTGARLFDPREVDRFARERAAS